MLNVWFQTMNEFLEADPPPLLGDFKAEIIRYERLMEEVNELPDSTEVGAIALFCGKWHWLFSLQTARRWILMDF